MEPNTIIEKIFSRFTIQSPILRDIKLSSSLKDGIPHLDIFESFDANPNFTPTVGRTYSIPMSVEALNIAKLLVSLVTFEKAFIKTATVNIKNFDFLGIYDSTIVNIGNHNFSVTQDLPIFFQYLELSLDELAKIFFIKNTNINSYFKLSVNSIKENAMVVEDVNEKYTRTLKYIGKEFEVAPEMFKTTFNTSENSFRLMVEHKFNNGNVTIGNTILECQLNVNVHESIAAVSEMMLVEPGIINPQDTILKFNSDIVTLTYNTLEPSLSVVSPHQEVYTRPDDEIKATILCDLLLSSPTLHIGNLFYKLEDSLDWIETSFIPTLTPAGHTETSFTYDVVSRIIVPETVEDPLNESVMYKYDIACSETGSVLSMTYKSNLAANAVPLNKKK